MMGMLRSPAARNDKTLAVAARAVDGGLLQAPCTKCGEVADDGFDGMCHDCYRGEHGPPDSYWEGRDGGSPTPSKMVGGGFGPYDSDFGRCVR
jgi:hypothetical protein